MRLDEMNPRLRRLAEAALATGGAVGVGGVGKTATQGNVKRFARRPRVPNATELAYAREFLVGVDARYESLAFYLTNGHRYRPDYVVFVGGRPSECHECKGGYALHSQQRARLAWDQARVEFPGLVWVWAVRRSGKWEVERHARPN